MSFLPAPDSLSGTVLSGLPIVVLDTETTGLDTAKDRVIEIGACRPVHSDTAEWDEFQRLVDPGVPVPQSSTAIHGITDQDLEGATDFPAAMNAFVSWAGPSVFVGYSVGFDMAVLKAEHERHEILWRPPRCLDVRLLVYVLAPNLPNPSLDTAADWLGIDVSNRHRALGDATVTARMFQALIPRLNEKGIRTLAQAENACRALTAQREEEVRAGWDAIPGDAGQIKGISDFARIDSFPYRHRIAELMSAPPIAIDRTRTVRDALQSLLEARVSSLLIRGEDAARPAGIVTERDILRAMAKDGPAAMERPVADFGSFPLVTIGRGEFVYRALTLMTKQAFRHLAVADENGDIVGVLSARDLLRQRADDAVSLGDGIEQAQSADALGKVWSDLTRVAQALVYEDVDARTVASLISSELRNLTRRSCEIAEQELTAGEAGPPPQPYAMMVLGSGGRGESLLAMDQDNAVIFESGEPDSPPDRWFAALGKRVADILNAAGVDYCKGGIMAANAEWRMDAARWHKRVTGWMSRARPEDIMNCDIFFDAQPVHGDGALAEDLRAAAIREAARMKPFLRALALNASNFDSPTGWFGRLKLDDGRIDLKMHGILPIFSTARVIALERGFSDHSTPDRLLAVRETGDYSERAIDNLIEAHRILLNLILNQQLRDIAVGLTPSNKVAPADLKEFDRQELNWALNQVPRVRDLLGTPVVG